MICFLWGQSRLSAPGRYCGVLNSAPAIFSPRSSSADLEELLTCTKPSIQSTKRCSSQWNGLFSAWEVKIVHLSFSVKMNSRSNQLSGALCNLRDCSKYLLSNEKSFLWLLLERVGQRLPFCLKWYIQPRWGGKRRKPKSEWLYGLLNPKSNIIVWGPPLSGSHQILLLVLIENPWGPSWKQHSALEKWYKKCLCPSYQNVVSDVCSTFNSPAQFFHLRRRRARGWRAFIDNFAFIWNDCDHGSNNGLLGAIRDALVVAAPSSSHADWSQLCCWCRSVCLERFCTGH